MAGLRRRKSERGPRSKPESERPLDDGRRDGTELWREIDGVAFCHWDRWLLRLALDESEGLSGIATELRSRARAATRADTAAEVLLAQIADLEGRLAALARAAEDVLDPVERASSWLYDKASRYVRGARSLRLTEAMMRTPRNVLTARAREGHWSAFPVSPARYFGRLARVYGDYYFEYWAARAMVRQLEIEGELLLGAAADADERLAIRRAILRACIEAMGRIDDSCDDLGTYFHEQEEAYLDCLWGYQGRPGILRDLIDMAIWEDYGLFRRVERFLGSLAADVRDIVRGEIEQAIAELGEHELAYQQKKALRLLSALGSSEGAPPR